MTRDELISWALRRLSKIREAGEEGESERVLRLLEELAYELEEMELVAPPRGWRTS